MVHATALLYLRVPIWKLFVKVHIDIICSRKFVHVHGLTYSCIHIHMYTDRWLGVSVSDQKGLHCDDIMCDEGALRCRVPDDVSVGSP